jgi:glycerol-3-phosphate acyltransferase PlsX
MGADHQPAELIKGLNMAAEEWLDVQLIAVGDEAILSQYIGSDSKLKIQHAADFIRPDMDGAHAVRRNKQASVVVAATLVFNGEADAMISAGNTGALVSAGFLYIKRLDDIKRAELAPMIPTVDNVGVLALDLGADMDSEPLQLVQYAIMGSAYRKMFHGMDRPRVGLLNVGTEDGKGNCLSKQAFELLKTAPINFIGNVEARDVLQRNCDVLVCDGFSGNILLKAMEGTANTMFSIIRDELSASFWTKLLALPLRKRLRGIKDKYNYKSTGGGILLGVNGLCFKAHGSSDALAIKNAISQARYAIKNDLLNVIRSEIKKFDVKSDGK